MDLAVLGGSPMFWCLFQQAPYIKGRSVQICRAQASVY
jgi:hypothetical protein